MSDLLSANVASEEVDLRLMFLALKKGWYLIAICTVIFSLGSIWYSLSLPNIYRSEALLAPVSENSGMKIPAQLGGLASLAGINIGGMGGVDKTGLAIEILKSREFLSRFIEKHDLLIPLMASKGWRQTDDSYILDEEIYDTLSKQWVRVVKAPLIAKPSLLEAQESLGKLISVSVDKNTSMVKLGVEHYSPNLAKQIVDNLISDINSDMRERDIVEAKRSIIFLSEQLNSTSISDIRTMLYSLIEEQTKTLMLADARTSYVFKTIDSAVVPQKKHKPSRALLVFVCSILGVFVGGVISVALYYRR